MRDAVPKLLFSGLGVPSGRHLRAAMGVLDKEGPQGPGLQGHLSFSQQPFINMSNEFKRG